MALLGPEGVNQVSRITPVTQDLRQIFIEAPVAKELGLHDGQVVAHGLHDDLMASVPEYRALIEAFEHDRAALDAETQR